MSRWDAASDYDYNDAPWGRPDICATCSNELSPVSASVYCEECQKMQRRRAALQDAAFAQKDEKAS